LDKDSTIGIVYCDAEFFGKKKGKWHLPEYHFPAILLNNCIFVSAFFRREDWVTVSGFDESMRDEWEDYDFWLKIIKLGRGVYKIPETLFFYRRGHDSRTKKSGLEVLPLYRKLYTNHSDLYKENVMYFLEVIKRREIEIDNSFILLVKKLIKLVIRRLMGPIRKLLS
jgi:GT2 family glycosyltransferase